MDKSKNNNLNIFYDFEFLEGTQRKYILGIPLWETKPTIEMISLGMVYDNGSRRSTEYLINKEFNVDEAWNRFDLKEPTEGMASWEYVKPTKVYWIRENVLRPIWEELEYKDFLKVCVNVQMTKTDFVKELPKRRKFTKRRFKSLIKEYGCTTYEIKTVIEIDTSIYDKVTLFSYYGAYDHVLMSWIFGKMINLPKNFNKWSYDLKVEQERFLKKFRSTNRYIAESGSAPLEKVLEYIQKNTSYPKEDPDNPHHALADAIWISKLYSYLQKQGLDI